MTLDCESDLQACVQDVFRRCPMLAGFAIKPGEFELDDVTCYPQPPEDVARAVREQICEALGNLVNEQPEVALLMTGRTFVRTFH
ncbi:MAG TPA: hypothetical protein VD965_00200 [Burkholderiales bacterium]|nr:hypothetical protein [Burkholderiales bacterium]